MVVLMPTKTYPIPDFCIHGRILKECYDELCLHVIMAMISKWDLDNDIKPQFKLIIPTKGTHISEVYFFILLSFERTTQKTLIFNERWILQFGSQYISKIVMD
jgi:hypothetical protein